MSCTPLMLALIIQDAETTPEDRFETIKLLIEHKTNMTVRSSMGENILHLYARFLFSNPKGGPTAPAYKRLFDLLLENTPTKFLEEVTSNVSIPASITKVLTVLLEEKKQEEASMKSANLLLLELQQEEEAKANNKKKKQRKKQNKRKAQDSKQINSNLIEETKENEKI